MAEDKTVRFIYISLFKKDFTKCFTIKALNIKKGRAATNSRPTRQNLQKQKKASTKKAKHQLRKVREYKLVLNVLKSFS